MNLLIKVAAATTLSMWPPPAAPSSVTYTYPLTPGEPGSRVPLSDYAARLSADVKGCMSYVRGGGRGGGSLKDGFKAGVL